MCVYASCVVYVLVIGKGDTYTVLCIIHINMAFKLYIIHIKIVDNAICTRITESRQL